MYHSSFLAIELTTLLNWSIPHVRKRKVSPVDEVVQVRHRTDFGVPTHGFAKDLHVVTGVVVMTLLKHHFGQESLMGLACKGFLHVSELVQSTHPGVG